MNLSYKNKMKKTLVDPNNSNKIRHNPFGLEIYDN